LSVRVEVLETAFDPFREVLRHQDLLPAGRFGAMAAFVGTMRDFNEGDTVSSMVLEHYPAMTERHLKALAQSVVDANELVDLLMLHRVGEIHPGEPIVLVATWSAHRAAAFAACEAMVEDLKSQAPFWKKERLAHGESRWVEHNTVSPQRST